MWVCGAILAFPGLQCGRLPSAVLVPSRQHGARPRSGARECAPRLARVPVATPVLPGGHAARGDRVGRGRSPRGQLLSRLGGGAAGTGRDPSGPRGPWSTCQVEA